MLADKAYPTWSVEQRQEILRGQFIQGIRSSSVQLWSMREMPRTIDEALRIANQQETVEIAQKRLHKEKHLASEALALETDVERLQLGVATQPSTNTTRHGRNSEIVERLQLGVATQPSTNTTRHGRNSEIEELTTQVRYLTKEVAQLRGERADRRQRGPVCWGCRERGHLRRNCPKQGKQQDRKQPLN